MIRIYIWFDAWIRTRKGRKPWYDFVVVEHELEDQSLHWFHEGYGRMKLYRLHKVDDYNFVAESTKRGCWTSDSNWRSWSEKPELALQ